MSGLRGLWLLALGAAACGEGAPPPVYQAVPVARRDIVVSAQAAGTIEPTVSVEVKSKAAGEILAIEVETGDRIRRGTLMVRVDQRQPRNTLAEAEADLEVARARLANSEAQKRRSEELFKSQSISEIGLEQALLDHANAKAEVVRARVAVENSRIQMDDTEILAPIDGTILEKNVERGQVISSPTRDVAGGTVLLRMADLGLVQVRALVDETDIGAIRPAQSVRVTVAAYPRRPFNGTVHKIEPQAVTEQNVTMFPVLVRIENQDRSLKPGMNCEVEFHIARRENVLAIPNAALRTDHDVDSAAQVLGLSAQSVRRELESSESSDAEAGPPEERSSFGGRFIVFVLRDGQPAPRRVRTGLTDQDYSEIVEGLSESDSVLLLPSASLVRSQERFRSRVTRMLGGGLSGLRSSTRGRSSESRRP